MWRKSRFIRYNLKMMNVEMSEIKYPLKKNRFSYNRVYTVSLGTPCMCIRETNCYGVTQHQEHLSRCYTKPASWDSALRTCMSSMPRHGAKVRRSKEQDIDTLVPEEIDISMHANKVQKFRHSFLLCFKRVSTACMNTKNNLLEYYIIL